VFDELVRVNLMAPVILAERFAAHAAARGLKGCIINMLDQKLWNPNTDYYSYTLTKHALWGATELMAMAYAPNVRVCAIAPGISLPSGDQTAGEFTEASRMNLTGVPVALTDIAKTAEFILGTPSINGEIIFVDAGQHLVPSKRDVMFVVREKGGPK
ncbi:MAG: SDR family oxidoreductase, partial [Alphaproteobacteria bacterium]